MEHPASGGYGSKAGARVSACSFLASTTLEWSPTYGLSQLNQAQWTTEMDRPAEIGLLEKSKYMMTWPAGSGTTTRP